MRIVAIAIIATLGLGAPGTVLAQGSGASTRQAIEALSLDDLLDTLPDQAAAPIGKTIETEILRRFAKSGSDTVDLLMSWSSAAVGDKNFPQALDLLDQAIRLKPDFAEAWNRRATVNYLADDYAASVADIRQTLKLQPRHFGALAGLGMVFEATGRDEQALDAFRKALAVDPLLDNVRETVTRLEKEVARNAI